ncbi:hypothetical protein [Nocardia sp. BMG111209]|uniref:hypothetical protein n=1 Tax=Nocardia sp. BMG111209 TaxID=1160137 RepID=UPI0003775313|nr:hypothetical protein [Nocardia sp. BMG111209]
MAESSAESGYSDSMGTSANGDSADGYYSAAGYESDSPASGFTAGYPEAYQGGPAGTGDGYSAQYDYSQVEPGPGYPLTGSQHGYPLMEPASGYPVDEGANGYAAGDSGWAEVGPGHADDEERSGDWEQWLDASVPRAEPHALAPHVRIRGYEADEYEDDDRVVAPSLVDRSGGNAGLRLRHPRRGNRNSERSTGDKPMAMLIMVGLAIVVVAVLLIVIHTARHRTPSTVSASSARVPAVVSSGAAGTSTVAAPAGAIAADGCEQRHSADVTSGTDPGGTGSGPDAIFAFERAYYVQRSGFAARAVVADDATVPPADQIQRGIDQLPAGTRYCVQVTRGGDASDAGQWEVRLTQQKPGEQPRTFTQIITTRNAGARTLITTIAGA